MKDNTRYLIVHCDDIGLSHAANEAAHRLLTGRVARSASLMMPCPWAYDFIQGGGGEHDTGLHLTLTAEWKSYRWSPLIPESAAGSLVDTDGFMWSGVSQVAEKGEPAAIRKELECQIETALKWGLQPTHLDTHMGTLYASSTLFKIYIEVAKKYGIPPMVVRPTPANRKKLKERGLPENEIAEIADFTSRLKTPILDNLITGFPGNDLTSRREEIRKILHSLPPGLTQIIIHPALDHPEIRAITGNWKRRYLDYSLFVEQEMAELVENLPIQITTWDEQA